MAKANNRCKFPIIAQPMFSMTPPVVTKAATFGLIKGMVFPILIIKPAAGITATTTIKALPNFCQNSKLNNFFILEPLFFLIAFTQPISLF